MEGYFDNETEWLLHHLWQKSESVHFPFILPHTVFYQYGKLQSWYFTAKDNTLRRKNRKNLTLEQLRDTFCAKVWAKYDIAATSYTFSETKENINVTLEHIPFSEISKKYWLMIIGMI